MKKEQLQQLCKKKPQFNIKKRILWRISVLRRYIRSVWTRFLACWSGKTSTSYLHLPPPNNTAAAAASSSSLPPLAYGKDSSDLVSLKICLFGDSSIGKTSFLVTYLTDRCMNWFHEISGVISWLCVWIEDEICRGGEKGWRNARDWNKSCGQNIECERGKDFLHHMGCRR